MDVFRKEAILVSLDEEGQLAWSIRPRNWRVRSHHGLSLCVRESLGIGRFDDDAGGKRKQGSFIFV